MIVSYAQNFEDVMLYRALRGVQAGSYVDVGAHDPEEYSVTKLFYDMGWRGINIEPVREYYERLVEARPEDINLNVAAGAASAKIPLFVIPTTGLSTFVAAHAESAVARGFAATQALVDVRTLDDICAERTSQDIHFLKIDVEGSEHDVLKGISFDVVRPWIVLVEATIPGTREVAFQSWEPLLTGQKYQFAYFDGLNRFYVALERSELLATFLTPPNVFDEFVTADKWKLQKELESIDVWTAALPATTTSSDNAGRVADLRARFGGLLQSVERLIARNEAEARQHQSEVDAASTAQRLLRSEMEQVRTEAIAVETHLRADAAARIAYLGELEGRLSESAQVATEVARHRLWAESGPATTTPDSGGVMEVSEALERIVILLAPTHASFQTLRQQLQEQQDLNARLSLSAQRAIQDSETAKRDHLTLRAEFDAKELENAALVTRVIGFSTSRSWKITAPMRALAGWLLGRR